MRITEFGGIDNKHPAESLIEGEKTFLQSAINVDITDDLKLARRNGFSLVEAGRFHSLWTNGTKTFAVKNGALGLISSLAFSTLGITVGEKPVCYAQANHETFFSDGDQIGVYDGTAEILDKVGTYRRSRNKYDRSEDEDYFDTPPPGTVLQFAFGRLWVVNEDGIWHSRPFYPRRFDLSEDFIPLQNVVMLQPVSDGLFVGTTSAVHFFAGRDPRKFDVRQVCDFGVVPGTPMKVQAEKFRVDGAFGDAAIWESPHGKILGTQGGSVRWLTYDRVSYKTGALGASLLREEEGRTDHISVFKDPTEGGNFRASDYSEAEIRRNGVLIT